MTEVISRANPHDFYCYPPCDPFFLIRKFRHGSRWRDCLASGDSISQGQLETKAIAAKQLVRALSQRKASTSNAFLSTVSVRAISGHETAQQLHCQVAEAAA